MKVARLSCNEDEVGLGVHSDGKGGGTEKWDATDEREIGKEKNLLFFFFFFRERRNRANE